jgi:hypothetical protein
MSLDFCKFRGTVHMLLALNTQECVLEYLK